MDDFIINVTADELAHSALNNGLISLSCLIEYKSKTRGIVSEESKASILAALIKEYSDGTNN